MTAGEQFSAASVIYGAAQWAILAQTELNTALEKQKAICYAEYIQRSDHKLEAVSIPYDGRQLKGYFHLPQGYAGGKLPCIVIVTGMDAFKEQDLGASGDRYLRRGFTVLCLDVPGQGSSLPDGIWYEPNKLGEVGVAAYQEVSARPEVDAKRMMLWGLSFGSFWATQMAAAEPGYAACAVMFTCFQPENWMMTEMGSSSFSLRLMFMTGSENREDDRSSTAWSEDEDAVSSVGGRGRRVDGFRQNGRTCQSHSGAEDPAGVQRRVARAQ